MPLRKSPAQPARRTSAGLAAAGPSRRPFGKRPCGPCYTATRPDGSALVPPRHQATRKRRTVRGVPSGPAQSTPVPVQTRPPAGARCRWPVREPSSAHALSRVPRSGAQAVRGSPYGPGWLGLLSRWASPRLVLSPRLLAARGPGLLPPVSPSGPSPASRDAPLRDARAPAPRPWGFNERTPSSAQ